MDAVIRREFWCCRSACWVGSGIPRPPRRAGSDISSISKALIVERPVIAGMSFVAIASSRGCSRSEIPGNVRMRKLIPFAHDTVCVSCIGSMG